MSLIESIGIAFQIHDDVINLESEEYIKTKGYMGEDIHEGKLTLIALHSLRESNEVLLLQVISGVCYVSTYEGVRHALDTNGIKDYRIKALVGGSCASLGQYLNRD